MKNKFFLFPLLLLIVPILVMILYNFLPYEKVSFIWYYSILYICYFSGIYSLYKFKDKYKKEQFNKYEKLILILITLFFISCIISTLLAISPIQSLLGTSYRKEGLFTYIGYFFIMINSMFLDDKSKKKYYQILITVAVIISLFSLFKINNFLFPYQYSYNGIFYQFNHFSYFLIIALVFNTCLFISSNNTNEKIIYYISYLILLVQLILNNTFGGYLALTITSIFIIIYYVKIKKIKLSSFILVITFIICSLFITKNNESIVLKNFFDNTKEVINTNFEDENQLSKLGTSRGKLWIEAIKMIEKRPIIGYGIENLEQEYHKIEMLYADKPHNMILALSGYIGIPGMLCFIISIILILYLVLRNIKNISNEDLISFFAVICFSCSSIVANSMFYTTPYVFVCLGIIIKIVFNKHFKVETKYQSLTYNI